MPLASRLKDLSAKRDLQGRRGVTRPTRYESHSMDRSRLQQVKKGSPANPVLQACFGDNIEHERGEKRFERGERSAGSRNRI